jgi:hypothetical protein
MERVMSIDRLSSKFLGIILLMFGVAVVAEERPYYMWTDDAGVLNFSQEQPRDRDVQEIAEPPLEFGHRLPDETGKTGYLSPEARFEQQTRDVRCLEGQKSLERLHRYKTIFFRGEDGFFRQLTEEAKQEKIDEAEQVIAENCPEPDAL